MELSGWGRYPRADCNVRTPRSLDDLREALRGGTAVARGLGRAYGDSALNERATIDMTRFSRLLDFDEATGTLTVEAGVVLADIIDIFLPRGWFPPVTPGTKFVTVGGMIAADVHGKNHHRHGSFGNFVEWIDILGPDGAVVRCSAKENGDLFAWTVGGMGLTGIILRAAFRLTPVESAWLRVETRAAADLSEALAAFDAAGDITYSVAWIDCLATGNRLGRSLLYLGEHAAVDDLDGNRRRAPFRTPPRRRIRMPVDAPAWALNRWSLRAFNGLYYSRGARATGSALVDWDRYFYPLDAVLDWNRGYGKRGFAQFQCVIPRETAETGLAALLAATSSAGAGSFLAVLKLLGPGRGGLSFPIEGYTLALDFPVNRRTLALMDRLDRIAVEHGGRFYLAKDARMSRETLERSDDRVSIFRTMRDITGARRSFASLQSERLSL